jgi:pimeloyl-ACP methyl ester carboxylesterase
MWRRHVLVLLGLLLTGTLAQAREEHIVYQGRKLVANLELAEGGSLRDGVVLMTHGTLAHGRMEIMSSLQSLLKERGINSLSITLSLDRSDRHGMFDCGEIHTHKHTDAMDEIGQWLDWLKSQGAGKVVLLGHSRGGNQTAWFASERDEAIIDRVVLIAPATWDAGDAARDYLKRYRTELKPVYGRALKLVEAGKGDTLMQNVGFIYCPGATVSAEAFVDYYRDDRRRDTPYLLKHIPKPVLVLAGSEDNVVSGLIPAVETQSDGKRVQLTVIDGADHFFRDLYAEDAADRIADFMGV